MTVGGGILVRRAARGAALAAVLGTTLLAAPAGADTELSAQLGLIPWKSAGGVDGLAARVGFERFLSTHPGVRITNFERLWLPGQNWGAAQVMSVAASAGPDLIVLGADELGGYVREGLAQNLDDLVDSWTDEAERTRWGKDLGESLKLDGHTYGIPVIVNYGLVAIDRAAATAAGLADGKLPASLEELGGVAARLAVPGKRAGLAVVAGPSLAHLWLALARQGSDEPVRVTPDGIVAALSGDGGRRAAEALAAMGRAVRAAGPGALLVAETDQILRREFSAGHVAVALADSDDLDKSLYSKEATIDKPLQLVRPVIGAVPGLATLGSVAYATNVACAALPAYLDRKSLSSQKRRLLAWEFYLQTTRAGNQVDADWLGLVAGRPEFLVPSLFVGLYPANPACAKLPAGWGGVFRDLIARARAVPPDPEYTLLAGMLGTHLLRVVKGEEEPEAALASAQREFDDGVHQRTRQTSGAWQATAWVLLVALVGLMGFGIWRLIATLREEIRATRNAPNRIMSRSRWTFALTLFVPAALVSVVFGLVPLFYGLQMSLFSHVLREGGRFAGLGNYLAVIVNPLTGRVALNTLTYLLLSFLFAFLAPLLLALVLSGLPFARFLIRSAFFLPAVASAVVIALIWQQMYDKGGPVSSLVQFLGFNSPAWLADPSTAMIGLVVAQAWSVLGVSGLTYLAGLSAISEALYEEAEISGAGLAERFLHVTWPHLAPLVGINLVGWLIASARTAEQVFLLTGGGPDNATYVVGLDIFSQAYVFIRFGYAMAEVWLLVAVILIFSIYQMRAVRAGQLRTVAP